MAEQLKRISIEVTEQEQRRLKAIAALRGMSIKEFVLANTIGTADHPTDEARALDELEALLRLRAEQAIAGQLSTRTVDEIFAEGIKRVSTEPSA